MLTYESDHEHKSDNQLALSTLKQSLFGDIVKMLRGRIRGASRLKNGGKVRQVSFFVMQRDFAAFFCKSGNVVQHKCAQSISWLSL